MIKSRFGNTHDQESGGSTIAMGPDVYYNEDRGTDEKSSYFEKVMSSRPPMQAFDAFPKTKATYKERTASGGIATLILSIILFFITVKEFSDFLYGEPSFEFSVDKSIDHDMQINLDMTVAMPCPFLSVDVRDAVGDRVHILDSDVQKIPVQFSTDLSNVYRVAWQAAWTGMNRPINPQKVNDGDSCRLQGILKVKKVTGNLHITTAGHGYMSMLHTNHEQMNLTHIIHELSFGPYFPYIVQPLDQTYMLTNDHFSITQYFVSVVPTTYVPPSSYEIATNQYSLTQMHRRIQHGMGVPGIFIKYDLEPIHITVRARTTTFREVIIRLTAVVGGLINCSEYGMRFLSFILDFISPSRKQPKRVI